LTVHILVIVRKDVGMSADWYIGLLMTECTVRHLVQKQPGLVVSVVQNYCR